MVMRPGGYTTATFTRFGAPLMVGALVTACAVAYLLVGAWVAETASPSGLAAALGGLDRSWCRRG